ncbi:ribonuclease H-like domain-containing protein [Chloroflexota bacterium]
MPDVLEAYLDIETTGLYSRHDEITVVGIYLSNGTERFAQLVGEDITTDGILSELEGATIIYTYNGSRFDLPFIDCRLGLDLASLFEHRDLMYRCWSRNLYGGLKAVERQLGIERRLNDINGYEAVRLWWRYINDYDQKALATLLAYNREDVINLKTLKERLLEVQ